MRLVTDAAQRLIQWDDSLCARCSRLQANHALVRGLVVVSRMGDGPLWYAVMALLPLAGPAGLRASLQMAVAGAIGLLVYGWLKRRTARPRPYVRHPQIALLTRPLDRYSFPSGHTLHASAFTIVLVHYDARLAWVAVPFATAIAASRPILGLHYPSDVLAGAALGAVIGYAVLGLL